MAETKKAKTPTNPKGAGRKMRMPRGTRGKALLEFWRAKGLSVADVVRVSGVAYRAVFNLLHMEPAPDLQGCSLARLVAPPLETPLGLISPLLAQALARVGPGPTTG